jgi:hypothetical protein
MTITLESPLVFKYIAMLVAACGGVLHFFLLSHGVSFEEELIPMSGNTWLVEKQRLIASGENPLGTVPIVYSKNTDSTDAHPQHIAV